MRYVLLVSRTPLADFSHTLVGSLTPSFHFVSLKPRRDASDREDEKSPAASLASKSRKEFRWLAQPPPPSCLLNYRTRPRSSGSRVFVQRLKPGAGIRPAVVPLRTSSQPFSSPSCDTTPKIRKLLIAIGSCCQK